MSPKPEGAGGGTESAPGQQKTFEITNPATGETKTVTQAEWREQQLGKAGWVKGSDAPEDETPVAP